MGNLTVVGNRRVETRDLVLMGNRSVETRDLLVTSQVGRVGVQSVNEKSAKAYVLHQALELSKIYNKKNSLKRVCMIQTSNSRPLYFNHPVETHKPVETRLCLCHTCQSCSSRCDISVRPYICIWNAFATDCISTERRFCSQVLYALEGMKMRES